MVRSGKALAKVASSGNWGKQTPTSSAVAMTLTQSNEPDQPSSSAVSITVLSVTPARAKKLFAFASVEIDIDGVQIGVHGIRAMRELGGTAIELPKFRDARRRVANGDHPAGRSSLADRQSGVRRARRAGPGRKTLRAMTAAPAANAASKEAKRMFWKISDDAENVADENGRWLRAWRNTLTRNCPRRVLAASADCRCHTHRAVIPSGRVPRRR